MSQSQSHRQMEAHTHDGLRRRGEIGDGWAGARGTVVGQTLPHHRDIKHYNSINMDDDDWGGHLNNSVCLHYLEIAFLRNIRSGLQFRKTSIAAHAKVPSLSPLISHLDESCKWPNQTRYIVVPAWLSFYCQRVTVSCSSSPVCLSACMPGANGRCSSLSAAEEEGRPRMLGDSCCICH